MSRNHRHASRGSRWVVKAGSNLVRAGGPLLVRAWMQQVAKLRHDHGIEVIWVTSGAIASAIERKRPDRLKPTRTLEEKQALSAIGQPIVMDLYNLALGATGLLGAQILLTYSDLADRERRRNFQNTLEKLLEWDVTPVLNENDAVATEEITFGDNDGLSAKVALAAGADRLVLMTDVPGLYDANPKTHPDAMRIERLEGVPAHVIRSLEREPGSAVGTGGMFSKISAAREASRNGIPTWLVQGDAPDVLLQVARDAPIGTRIDPPARRKGKAAPSKRSRR